MAHPARGGDYGIVEEIHLFNITTRRFMAVPLVLLASILTACGGQDEVEAPPPPGVVVMTAEEREVRPTGAIVGRTRAPEDVAIQARVSGNLISKNFIEGDNVNQGDLLFEIDARPYQAAVSQARAELAAANAEAENAKRNEARGGQLVGTGAISKVEYDRLAAAKDTTAASVAAAQSALERTELDLEFTSITAPIDGRIGASTVAIGDLINAMAGTLVTLAQLDPMWVYIQMRESVLLERMRLKNAGEELADFTLRLQLSNQEIYEHDGVVDFVDNRVDPLTGTINVRVVFPNPDELLLPGQYVTVLGESTKGVMMVLVPQSAVSQDQLGRFVLVVNEENMVEQRRVELGEKQGVDWAVQSGLESGARVIVEGLQKVRPGMVVDAHEREAVPFE